MAIICCISPSDRYVKDTWLELQFTMRTMLVKTNAMVNKVVEDTDLILRLWLYISKIKWKSQKLDTISKRWERWTTWTVSLLPDRSSTT